MISFNFLTSWKSTGKNLIKADDGDPAANNHDDAAASDDNDQDF
jgi:hypothetical protein